MVAEALAQTHIANPQAGHGPRYPHELLGRAGMRQPRDGIAQAAGPCNPDLLIRRWSPTTALRCDGAGGYSRSDSGDLQQRRQTSVLYISHDLSLVRPDLRPGVGGLMGMAGAGLSEIGRTDQVFKNPCHPYTQGAWCRRCRPRRGKRGRKLMAIKGHCARAWWIPGHRPAASVVVASYEQSALPHAGPRHCSLFVPMNTPSPAFIHHPAALGDAPDFGQEGPQETCRPTLQPIRPARQTTACSPVRNLKETHSNPGRAVFQRVIGHC